jgi:glycosyltransferase involved in cell wall biosynthesis
MKELKNKDAHQNISSGDIRKINPQELYQSYFQNGINAFQSGQFKKAIGSFNKALAWNKNDAVTFNNLGVAYYKLNQYDEAQQSFLRAVQLDGRYSDAWYSLGKLFEKTDIKKARRAYQKCIRWDPKYHRARTRLDCMVSDDPVSVDKLRIGFVSIWFERGQAYVTKILRDVIAQDHTAYLFARTGEVYNQKKLETTGFWNVPNMTTYPEYRIQPNAIKSWIKENKLDMVIFNEEYDWNLIRETKSCGVKVLTYLDYYKHEWQDHMAIYDAVLCSTYRTFDLLKPFCQAYYVGWGIDIDLFKPTNSSSEHTFFHNAGWLGIGYRKMTPAVIVAFDVISKHIEDISLFIHAQAPLERLPQEIVSLVKSNPRIYYHVETVPAPGLYHLGNILLFPSKLEGLGLPLLEGLSCGLPALVANAPPMNEFVQNNVNGLWIDVSKSIIRQDNIAFPETIIKIQDLANKMILMARSPNLVKKMGYESRRIAEEQFSFDRLKHRITDVLSELTSDHELFE